MTSKQLSLFEFEIATKVFENGLECRSCGVIQPVENFEHVPGKTEIKRSCKTCRRNQHRVLHELKKINVYPDKNYVCPVCERTLEEVSRLGQPMLQKWVLDHCHDTETFRGWLCGNCNSGLGSLKDSIFRVNNALKYLKKHKKFLEGNKN